LSSARLISTCDSGERCQRNRQTSEGEFQAAPGWTRSRLLTLNQCDVLRGYAIQPGTDLN